MVELLWQQIEKILQIELNDDEKKWVDKLRYDPWTEIDNLEEFDIRRLVALDHERIAYLLSKGRKDRIHVSKCFHMMEDLCTLARSGSSILTNFDPKLPPIKLSKMVKKHHVHTVAPVRRPQEEAKYQKFHLEGAR